MVDHLHNRSDGSLGLLPMDVVAAMICKELLAVGRQLDGSVPAMRLSPHQYLCRERTIKGKSPNVVTALACAPPSVIPRASSRAVWIQRGLT